MRPLVTTSNDFSRTSMAAQLEFTSQDYWLSRTIELAGYANADGRSRAYYDFACVSIQWIRSSSPGAGALHALKVRGIDPIALLKAGVSPVTVNFVCEDGMRKSFTVYPTFTTGTDYVLFSTADSVA